MNEYLPAETIQWCHAKVLTLGVDLKKLEQADANSFGERTHVAVYLALREALRVHMLSGDLPHLQESVVPRGGYEATMERGGMLSRIVTLNSEWVEFVRSSGETANVPAPRPLPDGWEYVGDDGGDRGWSERTMGI